MVAAVESMMYVRNEGVPWHGLGTAVDDAPTSREAMRLAGLNWEVEKHPLYVHLTLNGQRTTKRIEGKFATVRVSDGEVLGLVDEQYGILQNHEAFGILDSAVDDLGIDLHYSTAGSLRGGKEVFMAAQLPDQLIIGDGDVQFPYLMLRTGHDGGTALDILPTSVRPVCWNTVNLAVSRRNQYGSRYSGVSLWHNGDIEGKVRQVRESLKFSIKEIDTYAATSQQLADIPATPEMVKEFTNIVIPPMVLLPAPRKTVALLPAPDPNRWVQAVPADLFERYAKKREQKVAIFNSIYKEEQDTAWGLWNAATGYADQQRPNMWRKGEARFATTMFGNGARIKARAWEGITELAGVQ